MLFRQWGCWSCISLSHFYVWSIMISIDMTWIQWYKTQHKDSNTGVNGIIFVTGWSGGFAWGMMTSVPGQSWEVRVPAGLKKVFVLSKSPHVWGLNEKLNDVISARTSRRYFDLSIKLVPSLNSLIPGVANKSVSSGDNGPCTKHCVKMFKKTEALVETRQKCRLLNRSNRSNLSCEFG